MTERRIIGHMVIRNEAERYLADTARWLAELTNGCTAIYDDGSTDDSVEVIRELGLPIHRRPTNVPTFAEDESALRAAAWASLGDIAAPAPGDWVLALDADEFLVTAHPRDTASDVRSALHAAIDNCAPIGDTAITFRVTEVFDRQHGTLMYRTDGYWADIQACRAVAWRPGGRFHARREGGGSVPSAWPKPFRPVSGLSILHLGYLRPEDRTERHARYSAAIGHNPVHVASITRTPALQPWQGLVPTQVEVDT